MKETFAELFGRDIQRLHNEIGQYTDEKILWATAEGISNSGGNLCLHLVGNLDHFIGAILGKSGYQREREKEFSLKDIPVATLSDMILQTKDVVQHTLSAMDEQALKLDFPEPFQGKVLSTEFMLLHLLAHLSYHTGQINYHRRLLQKK